jgi:hypothetical protein
MKEWPTPMVPLMGTEISGNLGLEILIDLIHIMHHQDVFGGNGTICFELKAPEAIRVLKTDKAIAGPYDRLVKLFPKE